MKEENDMQIIALHLKRKNTIASKISSNDNICII